VQPCRHIHITDICTMQALHQCMPASETCDQTDIGESGCMHCKPTPRHVCRHGCTIDSIPGGPHIVNSCGMPPSKYSSALAQKPVDVSTRRFFGECSYEANTKLETLRQWYHADVGVL
jgi:hypothetical protein